ncbi:superoxide dismutase family protein [Virgibacillus byunsanensis]|uniref:Superoxide dismutase [Cu-Zn] n=1 Tax=Virgibacillus byunsanensis TaxID=570945 RepID=A0ABW3LH30_9BACI
MKRWHVFLFMIAFIIVLSACAGMDNGQDNQEHGEEPGIETIGNLSEENEEVQVTLVDNTEEEIGMATLTQKPNGVNIRLEASNLPPGIHGFHIHEKGICEAPSFESAGEHFNPTNAKHGFDHPEGPHAGDLPNIDVAEDGTVMVEVLADMVTLEEGKDNSLLKEDGTALMIHAKADDYKSQPSGDAGDRIACGVISG